MDVLLPIGLTVGGWLAGLITALVANRIGQKNQHKKEAIKDRRKELTEISCQTLAAAYRACGNYVYKDEEEAANKLRVLMSKPQFGMDYDKVIAFQKEELIAKTPTLPIRIIEGGKDDYEFRRLEAFADFILDGSPRQAYENLKNAVLFDEFTTDQRDAYAAHVETKASEFKATMQEAITDQALGAWYDDNHK